MSNIAGNDICICTGSGMSEISMLSPLVVCLFSNITGNDGSIGTGSGMSEMSLLSPLVLCLCVI